MAQQPTIELDGNPRAFETTPEARTYVHAACGKGTDVSEWEYEAICDPYFTTSGTVCTGCGGRAFPLDEFAWADTGENVQAYRDRLRALVPPEEARARRLAGVRLMLYLLMPVVGFVLVTTLSTKRPPPAAYMAAVAGGFAAAIVVGKLIPRPKHIDFRRYV